MPTPTFSSKKRSVFTYRATYKGYRAITYRIDENLVSAMGFAQAHGIAHSTVRKAIDANCLPAHTNAWNTGKALVKIVLDQEGMKAFYDLYSSNPHFIPCALCPHDNHS